MLMCVYVCMGGEREKHIAKPIFILKLFTKKTMNKCE